MSKINDFFFYFFSSELVFTNNVETETEVLSALSKLLLRRLPSKSNQTNTLSEHAIKSLKIEIDFAKGIGRPGYVVKPVPWFKRLVNENTDIKRERLRREYESRKARGVDLSMMIPAQYIVVVVSLLLSFLFSRKTLRHCCSPSIVVFVIVLSSHN